MTDQAEVQPALGASFEKIRPYIDLIDKLRSLGIEKDVNLPTIAVVGDQSSGKSSVLEAISRVQLPRGCGIVTRCPLELRMKHKPTSDWCARIKYADMDEPIYSPDNVEQSVRKAQDILTGPGKGVCDKLITLEVCSPYVPDLTLIDLPGLTKNALEGQPSDMPEQIKQLVNKYITRQETIILVVVPATVDIATPEAIQLAKQYDEKGDRTLAVITKPDLVPPGNEKELLDVLSNKAIRLGKGFYCVKCRGDDNMRLKEALEEEKNFFKNNEKFRDFEGTNVGTKILADKLSNELYKHIVKSLPDLKTAVKEKITSSEQKLQKLGKGIPINDKAGRQSYFVQVIKGFCHDIQELIDGNLTEDKKEFRIYNLFRIACGDFYKSIDQLSLEMYGPKRDEKLIQLTKELEEFRGPELQPFLNYKCLVKKIKFYISCCYVPASQTIQKVSAFTKDIYSKIIASHYDQYPELQRAVKDGIFSLIDDAQNSSEKKVAEYFEMEKLVNTFDKFFDEKLAEVRTKPQTNQTVPNYVEQKMSREGIMYDCLFSYNVILLHRITDMVSMILRYEFIEGLRNKIDTFSMEMIGEPNMVDKFMENEARAKERENYERTLERLRHALKELDDFA